MSKPLAAGEPCLLIDGKGRHYLLHLTEGARFEYHGGILTHSEIIGSLEGTSLTSSGGMRLVAIRPTFADFVLAMKRGAQVVYPKDLGPIVMWADIGPGMTVLEAGTGSGALAMALVRAVGPEGKVVSVEQRTDHAAHAAKMITRYFGEIPSTLTLEHGDVEDFVADVSPQRIVLDIPEPWSVVPAAIEGLEDGGVFCSYLPTVPQVQRLQQALKDSKRFIERTSFEVIQREWSVEGRSVRPVSQMVGHTGFLTTARKAQQLES